jgi:hypothetical protein
MGWLAEADRETGEAIAIISRLQRAASRTEGRERMGAPRVQN